MIERVVGGLTTAAALLVMAVTPGQDLRAQQVGTLELRVRNEEEARIPDARVESRPSGRQIVAAHGGTFLIPNDPRITAIRITALGYRPVTLPLDSLRAIGDARIIITLQRATVQLSELVIRADGAPPLGLTVSRATIQSLPALVEPDVFRALQASSAVTQPNDLSARVHLGGGSSDETGVRLDGFPLQNPFHALGTLGAFNAAAIDRAAVLLHHMPIEYDGSLGGTIDLSSRGGGDGQEASIGLLASSVSLGGRVPGTRIDGRISGRITYLDKVAEELIAQRVLGRDVTLLGFRDVHAVATIPVARTGLSIGALYFETADHKRTPIVGDSPARPSLDSGERLLGVRADFERGPWTVRGRLGHSRATVRKPPVAVGAFSNFASIQRDLTSGTLTSSLTARHLRVFVGADVERRRWDQRWSLPGDRGFVFADDVPGAFDDSESQRRTGAFGSFTWTTDHRMDVTAGTRFDIAGDARVWSPRVLLGVRASRAIRVELAAERRHQFVAEFGEQREFTSASPLFTLTSPRVANVLAVQTSVDGGELTHRIPVTAQVTAFRRRYANRPVLAFTDASLTRVATRDDLVIDSRPAEAYGATVSLAYAQHGTDVSLSYTWQRSREKIDGAYSPTAWDFPHALSALAGVRVFGGWRANALFIQRSGAAVTPVAARVFVPLPLSPSTSRGRYVYGSRNSVRLPGYRRLDVGVSKEWTGHRVTWGLRVSAMNVFGRDNPLDFDWRSYYCWRKGLCSRENLASRSGLPTLPSLSVSARW